MRVLNCMLYRNRAGTERAFVTYSRLLAKSGVTVIQLVHEENPFLNELRAYGEVVTEPVEFPALGPHGHEQLRQFGHNFYDVVRRFEPDIAISHQFPHSHYLTKLCTGILPHVSVVHCTIPIESVRGCDRVIVLNSRTMRQLLDAGFEPSRVSRLFNPSAPGAVFNHKPVHDPITIGYMGRLAEEKGPDTLLRSLARLKTMGVEFRCLVAGTGAMEDELRRSAAGLGIEQWVRFMGYVNEQTPFFDQIDVLAIPSRSEQFPLVLFEAWQHSTPVVATSMATDIISHDVNGLVADDVESFARALAELARNSDELRRLARGGFETLARFDERRFAEALRGLLEVTCSTWAIRDVSLLRELVGQLEAEAQEAGGLPIRAVSLAVSRDSPFTERRLRAHLLELCKGTLAADAEVAIEIADLEDDSDIAILDVAL